jgi:hypothetical protein
MCLLRFVNTQCCVICVMCVTASSRLFHLYRGCAADTDLAQACRPGRFDVVLYVPPPDEPGRLQALRVILPFFADSAFLESGMYVSSKPSAMDLCRYTRAKPRWHLMWTCLNWQQKPSTIQVITCCITFFNHAPTFSKPLRSYIKLSWHQA